MERYSLDIRNIENVPALGRPNAPAAGCARGGSFSRVRKVLKSDWEVGAVSPGVADHNTLGIPQYTCLVAAHVVDRSPGVRKVLKSVWQVGAVSPGVADHNTLGISQYASGWWLRTWRIVLPAAHPYSRTT